MPIKRPSPGTADLGRILRDLWNTDRCGRRWVLAFSRLWELDVNELRIKKQQSKLGGGGLKYVFLFTPIWGR